MSQLFAMSHKDQYRLLKKWGWVDVGPSIGGHIRLRWPETNYVVSMTHPERGGRAKGHAITVKKAAKAMDLSVLEFLAGPPDSKPAAKVPGWSLQTMPSPHKIPEPALVEVAPQPKETAVSEQSTSVIEPVAKPERKSHAKQPPQVILDENGEPVRDSHGNVKTDRRGLHMKGKGGANFAPKGIGPSVRDFLMRHPNKTFTVGQVCGAVPFNSLQVSAALGTMARSSVSPVQRAGRGRYYWQASVSSPVEAPEQIAPTPTPPPAPMPAPVPQPGLAQPPTGNDARFQINGEAPDMFEKVADLGGNTYVLRGVDGATYVARLAKVEA